MFNLSNFWGAVHNAVLSQFPGGGELKLLSSFDTPSFLEHIYNILLLLYKFYSLRLSATRNQCRVPSQRLYPVLLYLTNLRALRIHGADGVYPEQADLEILVGNIRIGRFKINVRQVDI